MAKIISDDAVLAEMEKSGADDFFQVQAVLQQKLNAAEFAAEKLKPLAEQNDLSEPWSILPSESAVLERMATYGITYQEAFDGVKKDLVEDARRLNSCAPDSAAEINKALAAAEIARERAAALVFEHETVLENITAQIFALGKVRKKIAVAKSLALDDAGARQLAHNALNFFVNWKIDGGSVQNVSGWKSFIDDLTARTALKSYIAEFVAPMEVQVAEIVKTLKRESKSGKIDLKKVLSMLAAQRGKSGGESLDHNLSLYEI